MLKYWSGKLTDTNKLQAAFRFQVIKKVPLTREGGRKSRKMWTGIASWTFKRQLRRVSQIKIMYIVCWVHGTQTHEQTCFSFCGGKSYWKIDPWETWTGIKNLKLLKTKKLKKIELLQIKRSKASYQCHNI